MQPVVSSDTAKQLGTVPARDQAAVIVKAKAIAAEPFAVHPWAKPWRGADGAISLWLPRLLSL